MTSHKLQQPVTIPASFWEHHIPHDGLCRYFGWSEETFWRKYTAGELPIGVNLMPVAKIPMIVFRISDLVAWEEAGYPAQPGALELRSEVLHSLIDAYKEQGVVFPDDIAKAN